MTHQAKTQLHLSSYVLYDLLYSFEGTNMSVPDGKGREQTTRAVEFTSQIRGA